MNSIKSFLFKIFVQLVILLGFALTTCGFAEDSESGDSVWMDVTDAVFVNIRNVPGWNADIQGKIYLNDEENVLKIQTSEHGVIFVDLEKQLVIFEKQNQSEGKVEMIKKDHGFSIVIKTEFYKYYIRLNKHVKLIDDLPDIRSLNNFR